MKEFIEKFKTDKKFNNKVQLCFYGIFITLVAIYAFSGVPNITEPDENKENYNYQININLNDKLYKYNGTKEENKITINKTIDDLTTNYLYQDDKYYKVEEESLLVVEEKEIYDVVDFDYLSLETINKYLELATLTENVQIVYLRDIVIGNNSEEYITIETKEGYYNIDYTQLMKLFKEDIEKLTVEIIIE